MYNEKDIQQHKAAANSFAQWSKKWHELGGIFLKALLVFVLLDLFMIAVPSEFGRDFMLLYVVLTIALLIGHTACAFQAKRYHAKRILEESYVEMNDYKNINNAPHKEN